MRIFSNSMLRLFVGRKKLESLSSTLAQLKKEKKKQESKLTAQELGWFSTFIHYTLNPFVLLAYQELQEMYKVNLSVQPLMCTWLLFAGKC